MKTKLRLSALSVLLACAAMAAIGCTSDLETDNGGGTSPGGQRTADGQRMASLNGSVSYNERLALTPEATLIVELRDTSYADAASRLIASQSIASPGQVPIKFNLAYNPDLIDQRNRYSVSARIVEADGRLAFINDTAYEVLTRGNPKRVDMLLVLVEPPPDLVADLDPEADWRAWRETPAQVIWANLIPNEPVPLLRVAYFRSTLENCARPGSQSLDLDGRDINVRLTLMQPPETPWSPPCHEELVELDTVLHLGASLMPGRPYRVIVNDLTTTTFTVPEARLGHVAIARSPVQSADVSISESPPYEYILRVVSGLPKGSGCSQFNGYEIRRHTPEQLDVVVTHHEVTDPMAVCTTDFPIVESEVPLGSEFEPGAEYTVNVNDASPVTFVAR